MQPIISASDSIFSPGIKKKAARGEAVDMDKYDSDGKPNPFHGWTLDFPEHVNSADRTYRNKHKAQGWYDDPENQPHFDSKWGGSGDYADRDFYDSTRQFSQEHDPNRGDEIDPSGALGQYSIGDEDLNEYVPSGHFTYPVNPAAGSLPQIGAPDEFDENRDLNHWPGMEPTPTHPARPQADRPAVTQRYVTDRGMEGGILPEGHNHDLHDDLENSERVFGVWHGGHGSYSPGNAQEDMETFPTINGAMNAVEGRANNWNRGHGGERAVYHRPTDTYHLTGESTAQDDTPGVGEDTYMDIYHGQPHPEGGWSVNPHDGPDSRIWLNSEGYAHHGTVGEHLDSTDDDGWLNGQDDEDEEVGSHPVQRQFINAGFEYHPNENYGDKYKYLDPNFNTHTIRAPNPRYGSMDNWHYEFTPREIRDRDQYARDASIDGPQELSFRADSPEEAWNLHKNLGTDLSEIAHHGWGVHNITLSSAARAGHDPNIPIEAHRRNANNTGYDRLMKHRSVWSVHHVPDEGQVTGEIRTPIRHDALKSADLHDANSFLYPRGNYSNFDEGTGSEYWEVPHASIGSDHFRVYAPSQTRSSQWGIHHFRNGRVEHVSSHPTWESAKRELQGRV